MTSNVSDPAIDWRRLGLVSADRLRNARRQLHWAVRMIGSAGARVLDAEPDDSHHAFEWHADAGFFVQHVTRGQRAFCTAVGMAPPCLALLTPDGEEVLSQFHLHGKTIDEGLAWLTHELEALHGPLDAPLDPPDQAEPHPVKSDGVAFDTGDTEAFEELRYWYINSQRLLDTTITRRPDASVIRMWPHHFDIASLITLDPDVEDREAARSVGVGMSPGDGSYADPYLYVTPWPYPEQPELRELAEGHWHRDGFLAAILTHEDLVSAGTASDQARRARSFVAEATAAALALIG
ncbi:MAG: hypothetical protein AAGD38_04590 [Acidobacteriota bacterium]